MKFFSSTRTTVVAAILGGLLVGSASAHNGESHDNDYQGDPYPLSTCPVTGKKLGSMGDPVVKVMHGRELRFCCAGCPPKVEAEPEKYLPAVDTEIANLQRPFYPLETCVVSDEELGTMGKPVDHIYQNRLVRLCCGSCMGEFEKDSQAHLKKIDDAVIAAQKGAYPLDFCLVSGDKLGGDMGDPIDVVLGNRLYRVCCKGCIKTLHEAPLKFQRMLDDALAGKPVARPEGSESKGHDSTHQSHSDNGHKHKHGDH